jgi:hypothetical protein
MERRLPGGYGWHRDRVSRAESEYIRESLIPRADGWLVSTTGDAVFGHYDVTGVSLAQDVLSLYYIPERESAVAASEVRVNVPIAVANTTVQAALYLFEDRKFKRIPGTYVTFSASSTGNKAKSLADYVLLLPNQRLFLGIIGKGGIPVLEGFQSGAGAVPRIIRPRVITNHTDNLRTSYVLSQTTLATTAADTPMVVYLSKEASGVL